jgi:hypothetical protein
MAAPNCPMLEHYPTPCWAEPRPAPRPLSRGEPPSSTPPSGRPRPPGLRVTLDRARLAELVKAG